MGLVGLARNRPDDAARFINQGLAVSRADTDRAIRLALAIAGVEVAVSRGDAGAALTADARAMSGISRTPGVADLLVRWSNVAGAEALLLAGKPTEALTRIGRPGTDPGFASSRERVSAARARFALGDLGLASELIGPLLEPSLPFRESAVAAHLLHSLIADRNHRDSPALTSISSAIDLAQAEGIRRPFLQIGGRVSEMLKRYQHLGGRHEAFVADLLSDLTPTRPDAEGGSVLIEHLTERELIVLRYLPTMLKAGEIASDLYVSVNTVKAHLRSMYRKLGVTNRREAVERARTVGLL
jgi:LuxR family maltose regulon positive regulatory protein